MKKACNSLTKGGSIGTSKYNPHSEGKQREKEEGEEEEEEEEEISRIIVKRR